MKRGGSDIDASERIEAILTELRLSTVREELVARLRQDGHEGALETITAVLELEVAERKERRVARLRTASKLPPGKTFDTLRMERLGRKLQVKLRDLARGDFVSDSINVLAFGLPGVGKSHSACAIGHALVDAGISVYFTPAYKLVQELRAAKETFTLPRVLHRLDRFEVLLLDDLGYVKQSPEDAEVLFTLLAERYERRSLIITSNLVFSDWERIFGNPMATAAAIDRVVHHSIILEFDVPSYRSNSAKNRQIKKQGDSQKDYEKTPKEDNEGNRDREQDKQNQGNQNNTNDENGKQDKNQGKNRHKGNGAKSRHKKGKGGNTPTKEIQPTEEPRA